MRVLAIVFWLIALFFVGWAWLSEASLFGLPPHRSVYVASMIGIFASVVASTLFRWSEPPKARRPLASERDWAVSGAVWVIVATGLAAILFSAGFGSGEPTPWLAILLIAAATLVAALLAGRFIRRHRDEIGEARFDTRNPEEKVP